MPPRSSALLASEQALAAAREDLGTARAELEAVRTRLESVHKEVRRSQCKTWLKPLPSSVPHAAIRGSLQPAKKCSRVHRCQRAFWQVCEACDLYLQPLAVIRDASRSCFRPCFFPCSQLSEKTAALDAVRSGSQAEVAVAAQRLTAATARVSELEAALTAAAAAREEAVSALEARLSDTGKELEAARGSCRQLELQAKLLEDSLAAERDAAAAELERLRAEIESRATAEVAAAGAAVTREWQARLEEEAAQRAAALEVCESVTSTFDRLTVCWFVGASYPCFQRGRSAPGAMDGVPAGCGGMP